MMFVRIFRENSHRYLATVFQVAGFACTGPFASKIFLAAKKGDLAVLSPKLFGFQFSLGMFVFGIILVAVGWYIMFIIDKEKSLKEDL